MFVMNTFRSPALNLHVAHSNVFRTVGVHTMFICIERERKRERERARERKREGERERTREREREILFRSLFLSI